MIAARDLAARYLGSRRFLQKIDTLCRHAGADPRQYELLSVISIWDRGRPPTVRDLSRCLAIRHNTTVELIDRAVAKGLAERVPDSEDRRQVFLKITAEGERLLHLIATDLAAEENAPAPATVAEAPSHLNGLAASA